MGGIKHHRSAGFAHDGQAAHIGHQVVVAERSAALAGHELVGRQPGFLGSSTGLVDDVDHVVRCQELALLDIDRLARLRTGADEVGLAAQEGRRLQHIHHGGHGLDLVDLVDVGEDRHADFLLDLGQDLQTLLHAQATERGTRRTVGLVEGRLVDERDTQFRRDLLQGTGGVERHLLGLDHAGAGDQEERVFQTDIKTAQFHALPFAAASCCTSA